MGKYALVKVHEVIDDEGRSSWRPDIVMAPDTPHGMHWQRFGSNKFGWDLVYCKYPAKATIPSGDYYIIDADRLSLTIGEIPAQKRQQFKNWLENHNYDTQWVENSTTVKEVLKDILHHLNERFSNASDLIKFVTKVPE